MIKGLTEQGKQELRRMDEESRKVVDEIKRRLGPNPSISDFVAEQEKIRKEQQESELKVDPMSRTF